MNKPKILDLFCGCGGLSLGFENAGFEVALAIDIWSDAIQTYNKNHSKPVAICKDIHELDNNYLKEFSQEENIVGVIGGPPCQGYSTVGTRDVNDPRNHLYLEYCRVVEVIKPKFFVIENVKGLLTLNNGMFKDDIINRFSKLGYNISFKVLNASNYGVPQNRQRVFFVGLKEDEFDFPVEKEYKVSTFEAISDLPSLDLMEELRAVYADRFVLTLINKKTIKPEHFVKKENGAVLMNDTGRKTMISAWQGRKRDKIKHPFLGDKIEWGLLPHVQALLLARFIRGDLDEYPVFLWK